MRLLITALLITVAATMVACGPREGQASNSGNSDGDTGIIDVSGRTTTTTESKPALRSIHPMAAAAAKAHMDELLHKRKELERQINTVESMIGRHGLRFGEAWSPDPDPNDPWGALVGRTLQGPPVNPFSPPEVASNIEIINKRGARGEAVSPKVAGWVWNEANGTLDAARDSAAIRAAEREDSRRLIRNTYGPYLTSTLQTVRGQVVLYSLYETPLWGPGEVVDDQWVPLMNAGYIYEVPNNPLSPADVAEKIVEVQVSGADGQSVSPQIAGWVWNSTDRTLFAAGFRED